ncbi:hypothetical protein HETIRDRAFT_456864 [Heterobasidion irregulare TC 32-1]|uniref:H/ACA ribonucleoprotein complex non-core subunit NAF1 n=1 Tax=Heterobasidion irregulare (strain TC 32-1) TaxID=747525 RepID=W4KMV9_HETIT|nr:uncharacterized protein HETIRDRAFT_456864 [Heterobasidion irregulare TC 32-1]ETW87152.1 hypothetical protein HETIRDRAFT_456864 [Heterobasidion irregulare TC 32-1]
MADSSFKVPSLLPQDLLIIQDLVGHVPEPPVEAQLKSPDNDHSIASSGEETNSEDEVEADILLDDEDISPLPTDSASESSDSDSSSEGGADAPRPPDKVKNIEDDEDDEESGPAVIALPRTKNEVAEEDIVIPKITEVGPDEHLEKVGEVMSILDRMAIVKGVASETPGRGSERALDSETLLVFENRQVMGYISETFGPTYQPMYQVKFNDKFPLDAEKVKISREVFHVPQRSNFVFVNELKHWRGSDASNLHDEEPAEFELEFSDDEQEAAHKARLKQRRFGSREPSTMSSRHSTPTPSQSRDTAADTLYGLNPYDAYGAYDMDYAAGPSRPPPIPYDDDPYSDPYTMDTPNERPSSSDHLIADGGPGSSDLSGRAPQFNERGRVADVTADEAPSEMEAQIPLAPQSFLPTPGTVPPATGQFTNGIGTSVPGDFSAPPVGTGNPWSYDPQFNQFNSYGYAQHQFVQPHINPRFASSFGLNVPFIQQQYSQYAQYGAGGDGSYDYGEGASDGNWSGNWNPQTGSDSQGPYGHDQKEV